MGVGFIIMIGLGLMGLGVVLGITWCISKDEKNN